MSTFTPHEKIIKAKLTLNLSHPFFSYILMNMRIKGGFDYTMGVDRWGDLVYCEAFVDKLSQEELNFVLCHEVLHVATLTFDRRKNRDMNIWNIATDLVINWILSKEGLTAPKDILMAEKDGMFRLHDKKNTKIQVDGRFAEEVYSDLIKNIPQVKITVSMDGKGNYKGQIDKHMGEGKDGKGKGKDEKDGKGAGSQGEKDLNDESKTKANEQKWKQIAIDATEKVKSRGTMSSEMERQLKKLLDPEVDWRYILQKYLTKDLPCNFTYKTPGKKYYSTGIYYPRVLKENIDIMVAVDVSGSIGGHEYNKFMSEVFGITKGFEQINLRILYWATSILESDDFVVRKGEEDKFLTFNPRNSGGTDISCVQRYVESKGYHPAVCIYLTDGEVEHDPKLYNNSLIVISENGTEDILKQTGFPVIKLIKEGNESDN